MMPCKFCGLHDKDGNINRGLKQKGKTQHDGTAFERKYVCQDCGAVWRMVGDTATKQTHDEPVLTLVKGGRDA